MAVCWVVVATGCMTRFRRANELAEEGKFVEAAMLFEELARENPKDADVAERLQRARRRAVEHALGRARQARLRGESVVAQKHFAEGLELREKWNLKLDGALETTVEEEAEDATRYLRQHVLPHAQSGEALTAEEWVARYDFLLRHVELASLKRELVDAARQSGRAKCERLRPSAGDRKPYWTELVAAFCLHFGSTPPARLPLPEVAREVKGQARVSGLGEGTLGELEGRLGMALHDSPWFSEDGQSTASFSAVGAASLRESSDPVRLSAEWVERVPYTVDVVRRVEEQVPVTECESYQEPNPRGGTVSRVREVTRTKTVTREVVVRETRFRDVARVFEFQALRVDRQVSFSVRAEVQSGGQLVAAAGQEDEARQVGYSHDVTFNPAGVRPTRPGFVEPGAYFGRQSAALIEKFSHSLRESWRARFCGAGSFSLEEGARCARVVEKVPGEALDALRREVGEDASRLPPLVRGSLPAS